MLGASVWQEARGVSTDPQEGNQGIGVAVKGRFQEIRKEVICHTRPHPLGGLSAGSGSRSVDQMYSVIAESLLPSYLYTEQIKIA